MRQHRRSPSAPRRAAALGVLSLLIALGACGGRPIVNQPIVVEPCPKGSSPCRDACCLDTCPVGSSRCGDGCCPDGCPSGSRLCGGACTSTDADPRNCGACGNSPQVGDHVCKADEKCAHGVCEAIVEPARWRGARLTATTPGGDAHYPAVAADKSGNATVIWLRSDGGRDGVYAKRYDAATDSWSTEQTIEKEHTGNAGLPLVAGDAAGNAIAVWHQSDGVRDNIWANRYDAASGRWGTAQLLELDNAGDAHFPRVYVDVRGNAFVVWAQSNGLRLSVVSNRYDATTGQWGGAQLLATDAAGDASSARLAFDGSDNAMAVWRQSDGKQLGMYGKCFDAATGQWGSAELIGACPFNAGGPQVSSASGGDTVAVWHQADGSRTDVWANRYDAATGLWGKAQLLETANAGNALWPRVAVAKSGNAIAVWHQSDGIRNNIYESRYDTATGSWGTAQLLETDNAGNAKHPRISFDAGGNAISAWTQFDGLRDSIFVNRYEASTGHWSGARLLETENGGDADRPKIAISENGHAIVVWEQSDGVRKSVWANHFR